MRPSVTLCLPAFADEVSPIDNKEASGIASLILHKGHVQCEAWNKGNFLRRLRKLLPERACILVLFVARHENRLMVCFPQGSSMPFEDLLEFISTPSFPPTFVFLLARDHNAHDEALYSSSICSRSRQFLAWAGAEFYRECIAIACEFSRWWELKSLVTQTVDFSYVASKLEVFIAKVNYFLSNPGVRYINKMAFRGVAWNGGILLLENVDFENLNLSVRREKYDDALKRLADAAYAPRERHHSPQPRLISTQAIFWLCELPQQTIDFEWFQYTRLSSELLGAKVAGVPPNILFRRKSVVPLEAARSFLDGFLDVPGGRYVLGSEAEGLGSEPPARTIAINVEGFSIYKRPITGADWSLFAATEIDHCDDSSCPVTNRNAFQALLFALSAETELRRAGLLDDRALISIPTEEQWEIAARGSEAFEYPWGNVFKPGHCNCDLAYGRRATTPGMFSPQGDSPFGCQDMSGNVREWTRSYAGVRSVDWQEYTQRSAPRTLETLKSSDRLIVRGGSYSYNPDCVKAWVRNTQIAIRADQQTGFRLIIDKRKTR